MKIKILAAIIALGSLSSFSNYELVPTRYSDVEEVDPSEGEVIMKKLDCATCHKIDKKIRLCFLLKNHFF